MKTNATFFASIFSSVLLVFSLVNVEETGIDAVIQKQQLTVVKQKQSQNPYLSHVRIPVDGIVTKNEIRKKR